MKLRYYLIIIPLAISLSIISFYAIASTMPMQSLKIAVIGYIVDRCRIDPTSNVPVCITSSPTIVENNSYTFHEGDKFYLIALVYNPNYFDGIVNSALASFDKNAVDHHYDGCAGAVEAFILPSFQSTQINVPNGGCDINMATSVGESNVTVHILYEINGKQYESSSPPTTLTVLPKTVNSSTDFEQR